MINILLLGNGGREHALAWKMKQSKLVKKLYVAPGNAGTAEVAENINIDILDFKSVKEIVLSHEIDMVIVGPEKPLVNGIYDYFKADEDLLNIPLIGPSKQGAQLEGSKDFAKAFMSRHNIPTARYKSFTKDNLTEGFAFLEGLKAPYVLKADGLASGKGVLIINDLAKAKSELEKMLNGMFGQASKTVVIEEFLSGIECSVFVVTDGLSYKILPVAKDYKRIGEGDTGSNTGGMGAVSPVSFADELFMQKVDERIIKPTIEGLKKEYIEYRGFVFIGLISVDNEPYVIEYNVRMGDPETEVVMLRIETDFVDLMYGIVDQTLNKKEIRIDPRYATTVMLVSEGYPNKYEKGKAISGLNSVTDSLLFHAGTIRSKNTVLTNGGRVLAVSSYGENMKEALARSYKNADKIVFEGKNFRKDIGFDL